MLPMNTLSKCKDIWEGDLNIFSKSTGELKGRRK
ncbi:hypothetical protein BTGOE5_15510 [Bacillus thuringiensis]|nr:hypothetical protein IIS_01503 [Bacillus cereus VD131]OFD02893.1 hypothetical protein BTGOE5_15510 [Bacillus thuringiensis]OFD08846.1 hypothetical protein BTGOE7_15870 [Bacillus thuringiensis]